MICTRCFAPIKIQLLPLSLILRIRTEGMEDLLLKIVSFLSFHISPLQVGCRGLGDGMQSPEPWEPKFFSRRARRLGMRKLDSWDSTNLVVPLIPIVPLSHPYRGWQPPLRGMCVNGRSVIHDGVPHNHALDMFTFDRQEARGAKVGLVG